MLLAEIYEAKSFENQAELRSNLSDFQKLCPANPAMFQSLRWNNDKELIAQNAQHLRQTLTNRTDTAAITGFITIWYLGLADERPEKQAARTEQIKQDIAKLQQKGFPRNTEWFRAIQYGAEEVQDQKLLRPALEEMAGLFPDSIFGLRLEEARWTDAHPQPADNASDDVKTAHRKAWLQETRELSQRWPGMMRAALKRWDAVRVDKDASPEETGAALANLTVAMAKHPDDLRTSPPFQVNITEDLLKRGLRIEDIPSIIAKGLEEGDRFASEDAESDLYPGSRKAQESVRTYWHLFANLPLAEAYLRMNQPTKVQDTLYNIEEDLGTVRPPANASVEDKVRYGEMEARYWQTKGQLAEKQGHKMDALVDYRNALTAFPPRRPRGDSREEVMADARRLWKEMGGTDQGWSDWETHSSLNNFNAGARGINAWRQIAQTKPNLVLTDWQGKQWKPNELKDKTTFVNYWATWCGPCRAELPYLQKLYERFKDRQDIVIISLNVDDDPAVMTPMLKQMGLSLPSIAARDFGYELLPVMALPSNWIVSAKGNEMFFTEESMDKWVEAAAAALEKASKK